MKLNSSIIQLVLTTNVLTCSMRDHNEYNLREKNVNFMNEELFDGREKR